MSSVNWNSADGIHQGLHVLLMSPWHHYSVDITVTWDRKILLSWVSWKETHMSMGSHPAKVVPVQSPAKFIHTTHIFSITAERVIIASRRRLWERKWLWMTDIWPFQWWYVPCHWRISWGLAKWAWVLHWNAPDPRDHVHTYKYVPTRDKHQSRDRWKHDRDILSTHLLLQSGHAELVGTTSVLPGGTELEKKLCRGSVRCNCFIIGFVILFICIDNAGVPIEHWMGQKLSCLDQEGGRRMCQGEERVKTTHNKRAAD